MRTIEPCCAVKQVMQMRDALGSGRKTQFQGFGDLSLTELLPALLTRYSETEMLIAAPAIPDQAAEIIHRWMKKQWARMDGRGKMDVVQRLTIIADLSAEASPMASEWLQENPFGERLVLIDKAVEPDQQVLLLPDIAITGPMNLRYGRNFTCTVTTIQEEVDDLWKQYSRMTKAKVKAAAKKKTEVTDPAPSPSPTMGGESSAEESLSPAAEPAPAESEPPSAPAPSETEETSQEE